MNFTLYLNRLIQSLSSPWLSVVVFSMSMLDRAMNPSSVAFGEIFIVRMNTDLMEGSSKQGKAFLAKVGSNLVAATVTLLF